MQTASFLRKGPALGIMLLFLTVASVPAINTAGVRATYDQCCLSEGTTNLAKRIPSYHRFPEKLPFITFNSYIIMTYNESFIDNTTFLPGYAYAIPTQIGYWAEIPSWLLHSPFRSLKNWFLFHSFIAPNMIINMSTKSTQPWVKIYPVDPNILVDIQNEMVVIPCTVVIELDPQAAPGPFVFSVTALAPAVHRINGFVTTMNIPLLIQ
jgi:hypothetical protein